MKERSGVRAGEEAGIWEWLDAEDETRRPWGALLALMALAAVLRSIGLDRGLWLDEYGTLLQTVRRPLWEILTLFPADT